MQLARVALLAATVIAVAACSAQVQSTVAPTSGSATSTDTAPLRIEVRLVDTLRMEPGSMTVPVGVPVTFIVTNAGALEHEFYLGDEAAQLEHAAEMAAMGGMTHDEPEGIGVDPGETKELTYTFAEAGRTLAGCHVTGHYLGGMKATIAVGS